MNKQKNRIKALAVAAFVFSAQLSWPAVSTISTTQVLAADGYIGVPGHWADPYLENLYNRGIMRGDIWGNLDPDKAITRAEFVSLLNRSFGYDDYDKTQKLKFKDMTEDDWFWDDISIAVERGYFSGVTKDNAEPNGRLTREQAVALICRNLKIPEAVGEGFDFTDSRSFNAWSRGYINASAKKGIATGYADGTFRPTNVITRGEAAKMLSDVTGEIMSAPGSYSFGVVNGNATVSSSGVSLKDTTITGDLYITGGVGLGFVDFENVTVNGEVIISGAGSSNAGDSSIQFTDSAINNLTIDDSNDNTVALKIQGTTNINNTYVKSNAYLEELTDNDGGFGYVQCDGPEETKLQLAGSFREVDVTGKDNYIVLGRGSIVSLILDELSGNPNVYLQNGTEVEELLVDTSATVTGDGDIARTVVSNEGVRITGLPDEIEIRPGVTANIYGRNMTSNDADLASQIPRILSSYPEIDDVGATAAKAVFRTNKQGTIYWAVTLEDDGSVDTEELITPRDNDIRKRIVSNGNVQVTEANKDVIVDLSSLKTDEDYILSAVFEDERDDTSVRKRVYFTSADNTKPNFVSGYPKIVKADNTSVTVAVRPSKDVNVYWAVFEQNSVAPTVRELRNQDCAGAKAKGIYKKGKKNIESQFTIDGLEEQVTYDLYLLMSDGDNDSAIKKFTFTTLDKTPPVWLSGMPQQDKIQPTTVNVRYGVNETGNIYYVVCNRGDVFPPIVPPATTAPDLNSEAGKQAIITGNNAMKNGKVSVTENKIATFAISGLKQETPYDVYMVAEDKSGNLSEVKKLQIKTTDTVIPTVSQEFTSIINDNVAVDSDIKIIFSEIVCDGITGKDLTELTGSQDLKNNISIFNMSTPKRTEVPIDFRDVKVEIVEGKTVVTIPPGAIDLESGSFYEFEISKIVDTSANKMQDKTLLPRFRMVAPMVELVKDTESNEMDMAFQEFYKSKNTSDNLLYDTILKSNTSITFDLYQKGVDDENFSLIPIAENCYLPENTSLTIRYLLDKQKEGLAEYRFEQFNQLEDREYGIVIKEVEKNADKASWSKTVEISVRCVVGSKANLNTIAANPDKNLDKTLNEGAALVNYPNEFVMAKAYTDTKIPRFIGPSDEGMPVYTNGDTQIMAEVVTDRDATVYFVIAPKGNITKEPTSYDIMNGNIFPSGGYCGNFKANGQIKTPFTFTNLQPAPDGGLNWYDVYYVLKGTPPEPSEVYHQETWTTQVQPPVFIQSDASTAGEDYQLVDVTMDSDCTIYWVVYSQENVAGVTVTNDMIKDHVEKDGLRPISYGTVTAKANTPLSIRCQNLEREIYYNFYAIAIKPQGGGYSQQCLVRGLTPADLTPPTVTVNTVVNNQYASPETPYKGTITLVFSEPIYYINTDNPDDDGSNKKLEPLTLSVLLDKGMLLAGGCEVTKVSTGSIGGGSSDTPIKMLVIDYEEAYAGSTISIEYPLYDENRNQAGKLQLTFQTGAKRSDAKWVATFDASN